MAFRKTALSRFHETIYGLNKTVCWYKYTTDDLTAAVLAAGYFNEARKTVRVNDVVEMLVDADGTPAFVRIRFVTVPDTGDVTVANIT